MNNKPKNFPSVNGSTNFSLHGSESYVSKQLKQQNSVSSIQTFASDSNFRQGDAVESEVHKVSTELYRKMKFAMKQTNDLLELAQIRSDERIKKIQSSYEFDDKVEESRIIMDHEIVKVKEQYVSEVDKAMEEKSQLKAERQYHNAKLHDLLPLWSKILIDIKDIIANKGHNDKTAWRSSAKSLMQLLLNEMEKDSTVLETTLAQLRRMIITINCMLAQGLIRALDTLKDDYITHLQPGSDLGYHRGECRRLDTILADKGIVVPLSKSQWSMDLDNLESDFNSTHKSMHLSSTDLDLHTANSVGVASKSQGKKSKEKKSKKNKIKILRGHPNRIEDVDFPLRQKFRQASMDGKFPLALELFRVLFADYLLPEDVINSKAKTLHPAPSLSDFRLLMLAFKNRDEVTYEESNLIFKLMAQVRVSPDVTLFNILMRTCEKTGAWRRAIAYITDMQSRFGILPSSHTFQILIDCCRHVKDEPAVIFETLRNENFPRK